MKSDWNMWKTFTVGFIVIGILGIGMVGLAKVIFEDTKNNIDKIEVQEQIEGRFELIDKQRIDYNVVLYFVYDKETNVEYIISVSTHTTEVTMLTDENGKPLLYK